MYIVPLSNNPSTMVVPICLRSRFPLAAVTKSSLAAWIAFLLSQSNHCKVSVQDWAQSHHHMLTSCLGQAIRPVEFSDDRLSISLRRCHDASWSALETELWNGSCQVYEIPLEVVRLD